MIPWIILSLALLLPAVAMLHARNRRIVYFANTNPQLVNITHKGRASALPDAALTFRFMIVKRGIAYNTIAAIAGAADIPLAVTHDMTPTTDTDLSYPIGYNLFGLNEDTERGIAHGAIAQGDLITTYAGGYVQTMNGIGAGTYYVIGRCNTATVNGTNDQIEFIPVFPYAVTVA